MKKVFIYSIAAAMSFAAMSAQADTKNFDGVSVSVGLSAVTGQVKLKGTTTTRDGLGKSTNSADLNIDYGIPMSKDTLLILGASYGMGDQEVYKTNETGAAGKIELTDRYSAFVGWGVTYGPSALFYGKLAYISAKPEGTQTFDGDFKDHTGVGYGLGGRFMVNANTFVGVEFMRNAYNSKGYDTTKVSASSTVGSFVVGYKF